MKTNRLLQIAEFIIAEELEKFQSRIEDIFEEIYKEGPYVYESKILMDKYWDAKARYISYYPGDPIFDSIFNDEYENFESQIFEEEVAREKSKKDKKKEKKKKGEIIDE